MNKVAKTTMLMAGIGAASFLSYKYLIPKNTKDALSNMMRDNSNNVN